MPSHENCGRGRPRRRYRRRFDIRAAHRHAAAWAGARCGGASVSVWLGLDRSVCGIAGAVFGNHGPAQRKARDVTKPAELEGAEALLVAAGARRRFWTRRDWRRDTRRRAVCGRVIPWLDVWWGLRTETSTATCVRADKHRLAGRRSRRRFIMEYVGTSMPRHNQQGG